MQFQIDRSQRGKIMASYGVGKEAIARWVKRYFPKGSTCLDVGACDGKWLYTFDDYFIMDAVEVWAPNVEKIKRIGYRVIYLNDVSQIEYGDYDLIIFGDVLEHMTVEDAQRSLEYATKHCKDMIVALPFLYKQDEIDGNPYERHIQDDLTPEIVEERYPQLEMIMRAAVNYAYYHWKGSELHEQNKE